MKRRLLISLGCAAALLLAFAAGQHSARQPDVIVDERAKEAVTVAATSTSSATEAATTVSTVDAQRDEARVVYRDRWFRPDGTLEHERAVEASQASERLTEQTAGHVQREQQEVSAKVETRLVEVERRVEVHTEPPSWLVGAVGGIGLDGTTIYGPQVHYRIAGPLHVSGAVLLGGKATTVLVGAAIEFF